MSYNYNYNRHNSIGGSWHLPPPQGITPTQENPVNAQVSAGENLQQKNHNMPGFRNPWYSPNQPGSGVLNQAALSQSPTKGGPTAHINGQGIPLLQQQQLSKRASFANQLPTTYEYDDQRHQSNAVPFIHPPTRADNPFNQYYTNQEVSLGNNGMNNDRRMSAAVDGTYYNSYNSSFAPSGQGANANYQAQYIPNNNAPSLAGVNRRSSVGVSNFRQAPSGERPGGYYLPPERVGRSSSIVQFQQYQQALQNQKLSGVRRRPAPKASKVYNKLDLKPKIHHQPKYRRCSVNSIHISPVNALSVYLTESYSICQPRRFQYSKSTNPKRVLTKPSDPKFNNGYDNEDSDYILYVNDILGTEEGRKYMVLDLLGSGTFGQVVKCQNLANQSVCAVKVIKSKPAYMNQSLTEVRLLEFLNSNSDGKNFIRLLDTFMHKEHLCLVFELLASNLYELIKQNQFQGLNMKLVKLLTRQLLEAMAQLKGFQMIHCDLKPENVLLCQPDKPDIKVIDFGSACFTRQTIYTYIQSRFYRSPEVILGLPYTESIDMWSLGCIVGELFLGLPMFPGTSEYNQIWKIVDMLGLPPRHMLEVGRNSMNFFKKIPAQPGESRGTYQVKTYDEYLHFLETSKSKDDHPKKEQPNKNYFKHRLLKDIILNYKLPSKKMTNSMIEKECQERLLLIDFLTKVLNLNPLERLTPQEALKHPFVNEKRDRYPANREIREFL
ncbi:serine-threonine protein kinase, PKA suppressor [Scheffersomyces xylosifermentans]|uniref:serine-threonine protein kinase, PKA suppressor n=1 Tax=Scheffersomyces xylosifermentans TaxID=1304137 RepID=UPI00315DBA75